jgi:hypothetical protein
MPAHAVAEKNTRIVTDRVSRSEGFCNFIARNNIPDDNSSCYEKELLFARIPGLLAFHGS